MTDSRAPDLKLSPEARQLWLLLASCRHYLKIVPTLSELAAYLDVAGDTVRRLYGELERKGYIQDGALFVWPPLVHLYNPAGWRRQRRWRRMRSVSRVRVRRVNRNGSSA